MTENLFLIDGVSFVCYNKVVKGYN